MLAFAAPAWDGAADSDGIIPETDTGNGWEEKKTESPPDKESWGGGQRFKSRSDPKPPSLGVWLFLVQSVTMTVEHSSDVEQRPKKTTEGKQTEAKVQDAENTCS